MIRRSKPMRRNTKPITRRRRPRARRLGSEAELFRECARLWSARIAPLGARCWLADTDHVKCRGRVDAAHVFGKKARPAVRFELWAGLPTCRAHHDHYGSTTSWKWRVRQLWGAELYDQRYLLSTQTRRKLDYAAVRVALEAA